MPYFRISRNIQLSTKYYLDTQINTDWTGVNTILSFKEAYDVAPPTVCIRLNNIIFGRKEVGATTLFDTYGFIIDIFARSHPQRLDLADYIEDKIKGSWTHYTHSSSGGVLTRTDSGSKIFLKTITENNRVEIFDNPERQDRFRHIISFTVRKP